MADSDNEEQFSIRLIKSLGGDVPDDAEKAIAYCHSEADKGNADAQWILGLFYRFGLREMYGASNDIGTARMWFEKSAEQGNVQAQCYMGDLYCCGNGVPRDSVKGLEMYRRAAEQGNAEAQYTLGTYYNKTIGGMEGNIRNMPRDMPKAREWFEQAAAQGYAKAQYELGTMYEEGGEGLPKDMGKAIEYYLTAAKEDNADAQYQLGQLYDNGCEGVPQDEEEALFWYRKASYNGHRQARMRVESREFGDTIGGRGLFELPPREPLPSAGKAQYKLGEMYRDGKVIPQNTEKAKEWFESAAQNGYKQAEQALAAMGYTFCPKEKEEDVGGMVAENNLGYAYHHGEGKTQDYALAMKWYMRAAAHGSTVSMRHIGELYRDGLGVEKDTVKAEEWFAKAKAGVKP